MSLTQDDVCNNEGEDEDGEEGEGQDEEVEETVVPLPNTVPHPGTVVVKTLCREEGARERERGKVRLDKGKYKSGRTEVRERVGIET